MGKKQESLVDKWLTEDSLFLISCWARDGMLIGDIAEKIGISRSGLHMWRQQFPEIKKALEQGKEIADYRVEDALYKRCVGCTITETTTYTSAPDRDGNRRTRTETLVKEIMPDVTACLAWLNNRQPTKWKRNRDNFVSAEETNMGSVTINVVKNDADINDKKISAIYSSDEEEWEAEWNEADDSENEETEV